MNNFTCIGKIESAPVAVKNSQPNRTEFSVRTPTRIKPLRFFCQTVGKNAERALGLVEGETILISGRLEPSLVNREGSLRVALLVNSLERMSAVEKDLGASD